MAVTFNCSSEEVGASGSMWILGQPGLHTETLYQLSINQSISQLINQSIKQKIKIYKAKLYIQEILLSFNSPDLYNQYFTY